MKERLRRILSVFMVFCMVLTTGIPVSADEVFGADTTENTNEETDITVYDDGDGDFIESSTYAILSNSTNKAVNITGLGWTNHAKVDAICQDNKFIGDNVEFVITPQEDNDKTKVQIQVLVAGKKYPLRTESGNNYAFADNEGDGNNGRYDGAELYIIEKAGDNECTIQAASNNRYATIDNDELRFDADTTVDNAVKFSFIENPTVLETAFSIEHKGSGKYIKTYDTAGESLTVDGEKGDEDTKFSNVVFGTEAGRVTVSLISKLYNKGIQSGNLSNVVVHGNINGNGWESIRVIPNGDGTISFRDSKDDKYITVKEADDKKVLACNEPNIGTAEYPLTDNEKFIIHTEIPPQSITGLEIDEKGGSATSIKLSWKNPECLFTGIEVYQKDNNGNFTKIDELADVESYKVKGLVKDKEYTFKIRVIIGSGNDALYADSNEITGTPKGNENIIQFSEDSTYGIVSGENAINVTGIGWENHIQVNAVYKGNSKIEGDNPKFIITPQDEYTGLTDNETQVVIESLVGEDKYPFRTEGANNYSFADSDKRYDGKQEAYIIKKTGDNEGTIQGVSNKRYATIDNGELRFAEETTETQATKFTFIENPEVTSSNPEQTPTPGDDTPTGNLNVSIEHIGTNKYIQTKANEEDITVNGSASDEDVIFNNIIYGHSSKDTESGNNYSTISFVSKKYNTGLQSAKWNNDRNGADASVVKATDTITGDGWETIRTIANGDGTISFKDTYYDKLITVENGKLVGEKIDKDKVATDNEKFILHIANEDKETLTPKNVTEFEINDSSRTETSLDLSWTNPESIFTSLELYQKKTSEAEIAYKKVADLGDVEEYKVTGLEKGVSYDFKLRAVCNVYIETTKEILVSDYVETSASTRAGIKPSTPSNVHLEETNGKFKLTWNKVDNATTYKIQRAPSLYGEYEDLENRITGTTAEVLPDGTDKYSNYYRIVALNATETSDASESVSLETEMFGDHTIFFADTDDVKKIDEVLKDIFDKGNDFDNDAQFKGEQWQIYFKPGDYTETSCMYLGFYTSFNGLGKTPYDVRLNNIAIPAYLPVGSLGSSSPFNATCNFWRSTENLSIINTGNEQGKAGFESYRPESFNWAVAQAAPLRRIYSERDVAYDWNYGWASGGYVADCLITGKLDKSEDGAGTYSGQQFFTRNSEVTHNTYGTTLNNFFMGVEAANNLTDATGTKLKNNNGYTNWGIPGTADKNGKSPQQVVTEITSTPKISEKPFLYIDDDGEYKIFVPAVRTNARGISWGEGKANDGMGEGKSLPISDFYIAKPSDSAATINQQIAAGKNIYFTPGTYHAETPIVVNRENAILLGSGMTSIIPDNEEMAMKVGDLDGIRIEGLIFDAGLSSKYLLQVGEEGTHKSHTNNPIVLQDLFFRVGGTTDVLTKADDALEINSDDVIGDHFWIWRADHGAGVEWYGNESKHGLIVNGDNVKCYALFNEHFQEYHTLWNGDNGEMYFYQNETCYDPISQDAWMSHGGTVKGYSSYKVSNDVKNHYAVGLGVYNVFIYTGPSYDSSGVGIQLDNAIEVPNKPNVLVENACIQTFANEDSNLVRINHIINGVGGSASSGYSADTGETGEGWSRKFLLYYNNGEAEYGKETNPLTFDKANDERGFFIGTETKKLIEQPEDEEIYLDRIKELINELSQYIEENFTKNSWRNADIEKVLGEAKQTLKTIEDTVNSSGIRTSSTRSIRKANTTSSINQALASKLQSTVNKACTKLEAAKEKLIYIKHASDMEQICLDTISESDYDTNSSLWRAYQKALEEVKAVLKESENANLETKKEIYELQQRIDEAYRQLGEARKGLTKEDYNEDYNFLGKTADISKLQEAYNKYLAYKESDYTSESWTEFAKAFEAAKIQIEHASVATQTGVDEALAALETAASGLVRKDGSVVGNDLSKLTEAYNKYAAYKQSDYTPESWTEFAKALEAAKAQLDKGDAALQVDINNALDALNAAAEKLVKVSGNSGNQGNNGNNNNNNGNQDNNNNNNQGNNSNNNNSSNSSNQGSSSGNSSYDPWLWAAASSSGASDSDMEAILAALKEITDTKSDLSDTQAKADVLLAIIDSLVKNMDTTTGEVQGVMLNKSSVTLNKGKKVVLKVTIMPADASNKTVIWNSSNTSVATVTKNGTVKAVSKGTAKITATTADGLKVASCKVTVKMPSKKITLNKKKVYIVKESALSLESVIKPAGSTDKIKWSSSKPSVATVKNGKIKAKKTGTVTVTAKTTSGKKAKCTVYVVKKPSKDASIKLNSKKISIKKGGWVCLNEVLDISDAANVVKWKSSKKKVASVDVYGYVKAKKKGKTTVTITTNTGRKAKYKVTVK